MFENFLQDLLVMLNKPEWPAAEVLLTLLGRLLVSKTMITHVLYTYTYTYAQEYVMLIQCIAFSGYLFEFV